MLERMDLLAIATTAFRWITGGVSSRRAAALQMRQRLEAMLIPAAAECAGLPAFILAANQSRQSLGGVTGRTGFHELFRQEADRDMQRARDLETIVTQLRSLPDRNDVSDLEQRINRATAVTGEIAALRQKYVSARESDERQLDRSNQLRATIMSKPPPK